MTNKLSPIKTIITEASPLPKEQYPNANSYLKKRRTLAKNERRSEILSFLDSSVTDEENFKLPSIDSGEILSSSYHSTRSRGSRGGKKKKLVRKASKRTLSLSDHQPELSIDDVFSVRSIDDDTSEYDSETIGTDMMSAGSLGCSLSQDSADFSIDMSITHERESKTDDKEEESLEKQRLKEEERRRQHEEDEAKLEALREEEEARLRIEEEAPLKGELENEPEESSECSYEEEEVISDDDEYMEEVVVSDDEYEEEEVLSDEESEEGDYEEIEVTDGDFVLDGSIWGAIPAFLKADKEDDELVEVLVSDDDSESSFEEYVEEEVIDEKYRNPLDIIEEVEYDTDENDDEDYVLEEVLENGETRRLDAIDEEDYFSETEEEDDFVEEVLDHNTRLENDGEVIYFEDDDLIIEEDITPVFEVPVIPVLEAWHKAEEERVAAVVEEGEELPEEAPRTPRNVILAIIAASAAEFKLRPVPKDHKSKFVPMATTAASLGRLTKLDENVVEGVGHAVKKVDDWSPTGGPIVLVRSMNTRIVNEAAAMGRMLRLKERILSNQEENFEEEEEKIDIDELLDEKGRKVFRTSVLVQHHIRDCQQEILARDWTMGVIEDSANMATLSMDNVKLPTQKPPKFAPSVTKLSRQEINDAIAQGVAEGAWERKYRLERPQRKLRITEVCRCTYCEHPNAFQTHTYKQMVKQ